MCFSDFPACFQTFKTLCLLDYALMIRHDYDITSSLRRGALQLWYQSQMVNTLTDADLSTAVQNALQTLLPQIRAEIREEFRTSSGPSDAGGNPSPATIHTWLERFNKQKPYSFEKATAPMDAENWISHMEKIFDVMGCEDAFKTRLAVYKFEGNALAWWKAYKQAKGGDAWLVMVTWADFKKGALHLGTHENNGWRTNVHARLGSRDVSDRLGRRRSLSESPPSSDSEDSRRKRRKRVSSSSSDSSDNRDEETGHWKSRNGYRNQEDEDMSRPWR
nr:hypothetical protein [Tanacetum cinerariifolium]